MEISGADVTPGQVKTNEVDNTSVPKMVSGQELQESAKSDPVDSLNKENGDKKEADHVENPNIPKDAANEWPETKPVHNFYFVKYRSYEEPKLKAKIEHADKDIQKKSQARFQIIEALKAKRSERANIISQLKPLTAENKQYREVMDEKRKVMEPLHAALTEFRATNKVVREKGIGLCSSEEELDELIKSLHYRINHENISLNEEKQLIREIKLLEGTRGKVIANASMRTKIQDSLGEKEAILDQVKLIGLDIDGVRKEQQEVRTKIKHLEEDLKAIDDEIKSLQEELTSVNEKKNSAFESLLELRKTRDEVNTCFYQNRSILNNAKELAAKKDVAALEVLSHSEAEKFMLRWSSNKSVREDYGRRILSSLDSRQLSRDGRMRNPDEKPILLEAPQSAEVETAPLKNTNVKGTEMDAKTVAKNNTTTKKAQNKEINESTEVEVRGKLGAPAENANTYNAKEPTNELSKSPEIDAAKLKEMKREEEIAKARIAMERKKRLAEKASAKAAARAQKEAEKKLKEKEKRAKKKIGTLVPTTSDEPVEMDTKIVEQDTDEVEDDAPIPAKAKETKENVRHRNLSKNQTSLPKVILRRKRSHSYRSWVVWGMILALLLVIIGSLFFFRGKITNLMS